MTENNKSSEVGAAAKAAMVRMEQEDHIFKKPILAVVHKKVKKKQCRVLDEDTYLEEMAKIIQRDFFPDLEKLKAQNEFLEATEKKDHQKLRELFIKYSSGRTPQVSQPNASPATFETPRSSASATPRIDLLNSERLPEGEDLQGDEVRMKPKISPNMSLDSYLATYTSEDNVSFQELMEEMGRKCRARFASQLQEEESSQLLMLKNTEIPSIESQANHIHKPLGLDTWSYRAKNYIMYVPDGATSPEDLNRPKQEVVHTNTRLEAEPFDYQRSKKTISQLAKSQEKVLSGKIGVDGSTLLEEKKKALETATSDNNNTSTTLASLPLSHSLVRTPSPTPGEGGETPLMTWGEIEGTPFRLDGSDTPIVKSAGAAFKMASISKREQIALDLADKASQRHRTSKKKAMEAAKRSMFSPSPRMATGSTTERLAQMSPAAQRLLTSQMRRNLGISPMPSPKVSTPRITTVLKSKSSTPVVINTKRKSTTPRLTPTVDEEKRAKPNNLTDDLLQINLPKRNRLRAADFFT